MQKPRRWEVWEVDLQPAKGRDQRGVRACLVISIDALNQSNFGTVVVCPITTTFRESFTWRPGLVAEDLSVVAEDWTARPTWVETDQIATIDVTVAMRRPIATLVNATKRFAVSDSVAMMLGLE